MTEGHESVAEDVKLKDYQDSLGENLENTLKKTPFIGKGYATIDKAVTNIEGAKDADDLASAAGQLVTDGASFVAGAAMDMATFVLDPVGWLVSNGLNMLIELIQPLQDALHSVTGDGPALTTASGNFVNIGNGFVALAEDFVKTGDEALKEWQGEAGKAAKEALADFAVGIKGIGSSAGSVAETLEMWGTVMKVIEEVVKAIISELVSALIYIWLPALAASVVSLGSSVAAAWATSFAKLASAMSKVTKHLGKIGKLLDDFMVFLGKWTDDLIKQGSRLSRSGARVTPGVDNAVGGAVAKASGRQMAETGTGLGGVLRNAPGNIAKQTVGFNPAELAQGSAYADAAVVGAVDKSFDHAASMDNMEEAENIGGDQSAEETRSNLDMGQ